MGGAHCSVSELRERECDLHACTLYIYKLNPSLCCASSSVSRVRCASSANIH